MEKTIKYLENGEYHYATVRDVGDLAKLKTDSKDDLVTAINELYLTGGGGSGGKPEGYDNLVNNVADAIQKQHQMASSITNMEQNAQLSDAEMAHMKQVQEELHQEYIKALKELNEAVEKAKADAADLAKKTDEMQDKIDETFANVDKEVSDVHKQLDAESKGLHKDLDETKTNLESTRKDLLNSTQEYGQVHSEVKELQDKFNRRIWSTDLDPVREQVSKNATEVSQTKDELKRKADQSNLDLVTNSVENLSAQVKQNASGLEVAVKRDELGGDVSRLLNDKTNLLLGTRSFSGEDNWKNRDTVTIEPGYYKGLKSAAVQVLDGSIYQPYRVKADTDYTFSFFAREDKDNPKAKLAIKPINAKNINIDNEEQVVHITTEWQRFAVTFSADKECDVSIQVIQGPEASNNVLHLAGLKLQYGQNNTPWEPNEADVAENIEKNESRFNVFSDQIAGLVKKQEKMGDTERQLDTRITETAEGLKQTSKDLQNANGKITEFQGQLESTAKGLKTDYEKYTNEAVGQISDSTLNLIRNSSFQNKDEDFAQWQNVSTKANVRQDENGLRWVELTQSGLTTDNPQGLTSNYFNVKQGKVTVAVDIKSGDKATLDNESVLFLELYNDAKKRVDFRFVTLSELGLSKNLLDDHKVHRGLYRLGIDRNDAQYMTVKAHLMRNGDLYFTNFSARLSSIDDGAYEPNPDDINQQILKQNTKIEQNAKEVAIKANSVDVTRDIKSAVDGIQVGTSNLLHHSDTFDGWIKGYSVTVTADKYLDGRIAILGGAGVDGGQLTTFLDGPYNDDLVTWVVYAKADNAGDKLHTELWGGGGNTDQPLTNNWQAYKFSGHRNIDHPDFYLWGCVGNKGNIYVALPFAVVGNTIGTWGPNSCDTSAEIKSAKDAAIQVASDQINLHVNELRTSFDDKLNKRVNEVKTASEKFTSDGIEQVVTKVTEVKNDVDGVSNKVDNLQVGGRNLLHDTSDQWRTLQGDTWLQKTTASTCWTSTVDYHSGNTFTYAAKITNNSHQQAELEIWLCDTNKNLINGQTFHAPIPQGANAYDVSVTFPITAGTWYIRSWVIFTGGHAPNGDSVQVKEERLVEGNLAGAWTPNPDDVNQKIDSVKTEVTASVKNLGDRVTTQVNSITTRMSDQIANAVELIQKSDFSDGSKGSWTVQSIISATNPAPPAELGISGMKVIQSNVRDSYEDVWHSVTPGEKFNIDFWCAPSGVYDSSFGLVFYDANKELVPNNQWLGVRTDHSAQWKHYTGEITAPGNSAFARPWFQIDMSADQHNTSWLAKPHIRRQDPRVTEAIKEVNTKWDVANGQIQGKVTEAQVNNILNGKGYATQAWAQSNFRMKSDSIDLEVRKITDPISSKLNSVNEKDGINLLKGTSDFTGSWRDWSNDQAWKHDGWIDPNGNQGVVLTNRARSGYYQPKWIDTGTYTFSCYYYITGGDTKVFAYLPPNGGDNPVVANTGSKELDATKNRWNKAVFTFNISKAGNSALRLELTNSNSCLHIGSYKLEKGSYATPWSPSPRELPTNSNIISKINVSPEKIRLLSSKIEIDGNTYIHGTLNVPNVRLDGGNKNYVDLNGNGINIANAQGTGMHITQKAIEITANTNGQAEIEGVITPTWSTNQINQNGIGIILTTQQQLGRPYGGDIFTIGTMPKQGVVDPAVILDATGITGGNKGFNWFVPHTVSKDGGIVRMPGAQDDLLFTPIQLPGSRQSGYYQPSLSLIHQSNKTQGNAGIAFQWDDIVPWGRIETSHSYFAPVGTTNNAGLGIGWVHWSDWNPDGYIPMIHRREGKKGLNAGLAFFGNGHVVYWSQDFRASLLVGLKATAGKLWPNLGGF